MWLKFAHTKFKQLFLIFRLSEQTKIYKTFKNLLKFIRKETGTKTTRAHLKIRLPHTHKHTWNAEIAMGKSEEEVKSLVMATARMLWACK